MHPGATLLLLLAPGGGGSGVDPDPALTACGTDMLASGLAFLTVQLQAHLSQPIIYQRGARKVALCATPGKKKLYRLTDGDGNTRIDFTDRDFLIPTASLVIDGSAVLPARGDFVKTTEAGVTRVYEVSAPGGEAVYDWSDPYRLVLRVHAKLVEDA